MAVPRKYRFPIGFDAAFPRGLVMVGDVTAAVEFQSQEDRNRGREARPLLDEQTNLRIFKATVTDPDETKAKRASFEVNIVAEVQPVPPTNEVVAGMRPIVLEGLQVEPRIAGQGEFKYLTYQVWATGLADPAQGSGRTSKVTGAGSTGSGKDSASSAKEAA